MATSSWNLSVPGGVKPETPRRRGMARQHLHRSADSPRAPTLVVNRASTSCQARSLARAASAVSTYCLSGIWKQRPGEIKRSRNASGEGLESSGETGKNSPRYWFCPLQSPKRLGLQAPALLQAVQWRPPSPPTDAPFSPDPCMSRDLLHRVTKQQPLHRVILILLLLNTVEFISTLNVFFRLTGLLNVP